MNAHDEMLDNVAVYALGALPAASAREVREHLKTCAQCRAEYDMLAPVVDRLAYSAEACADAASAQGSTPPPGPLLKRRIMRAIRPNVGEMRAVRPIVWPAYAVAAACFAIALATGIVDMSLSSQLHQTRAQMTQISEHNAQVTKRLADQRDELANLVAPESVHYPVAYGQVVKHGSRLYIAMDTLPPPPKGKVYQAWTLREGSSVMAPSITFVPAQSGVEVQELPVNAKGIVAVALSVEPAGGSKQPTSKPVFVLKLS
ncbi:MAG: anti-sigma factor domain-containing protein [Candidatus Baltobacteraceae bacterium]